MKQRLGIIVNDIFNISFMLYLLLQVVDFVKEGFVSNVFNQNTILILVLLSGIVKAFNGYDEVVQLSEYSLRYKDWLTIIVFSLFVCFVVYYKTYSIGWISLLLSILALLITILISYLILDENTK